MTLQDFCSEETLLGILKINKTALYCLRKKGLPYITLNSKQRLYSIPSLCEWFLSKEIREGARGSGGPDQEVAPSDQD